MIYIIAMLLTAIIETFVLWCLRYRKFWVLVYFFVLNLISNFIVNFIYQNIWYVVPKIVIVPVLELSVFIFEIFFMGIYVGYNKKMFASVFLTNFISFMTGVILFGI